MCGGKETKSRAQAQFGDWADRPGGPFLPEHRGASRVRRRSRKVD